MVRLPRSCFHFFFLLCPAADVLANEEQPSAAIVFGCVHNSISWMDQYQGPRAAGEAMSKALVLACLDRRAPADLSGHDDIRALAKKHSDEARAIDPDLPDAMDVMSILKAD